MLPSGWERKPIKALCESIIDCVNKTAKTVDYETPFKMIRTTNVRHGKVDTSSVRYVTEDTYAQWIRRGAPQKGDVIFTREAPVGEVGILHDSEGVFLGQRTMMYRADPKISDNHFLLYSLLSGFCQKQIEDFSNGGTVAHMRVPDCGEILIDSPPLQEQQKIAKILSTWDKAISTTEALIDNSKQQKKALMQQLLTGKKRFAGFEGEFGIREGYSKRKLGALPLDWNVTLMSKHYWYQEGPGVRKHQFTETGVKLFNGTNIQKSRINIKNTKTHISEEEANGSYNHFLADEGDLVIACSGISVDKFEEKIAFIEEQHLPICMNTSTMRFKVKGEKDACIHYLRYYMMSTLFKDQIRRQITGSAQLNFGPSHVSNCFIVLPTFEEQQKIASMLTAGDKEIDVLEQQLADLKQEKKALMQQLLTGKRRVKVDESKAAERLKDQSC